MSVTVGHAGPATVVDAVIEDARRRARRRRLRNGGVAALVALAALAAWSLALEDEGVTTPVGADRPHGAIALTSFARGRPQVRLWTPGGMRSVGMRGMAFGWSPDGTRLLVQRGSALYAVGVESGHEVLLTRHGSGFNAAWAPDGSRVVFEAGPVPRSSSAWRRIVVVGADGRNAHMLPGWALDGGFFTGNVTWAPDGRDVVFAGRTATNRVHGLYTVAADGHAQPRPLAIPAAVDPAQPAFSPDGSRLAFTDSGTGSIGDLVIAELEGRSVQRIEGGTAPVWSPDGTMLAYRTHGDSAWWTVHADGTHRTRLLAGSWAGLSWSPDSRYVAYAGGVSHSPNGDVYAVHPDGTGRHRLVHGPSGHSGLPLWRGGTATTEAG